MKQISIVKNGKKPRSELFDPLKLHKSIVAACLAVREFEGAADVTAERVCKAVLDWLMTKDEVTSADLRRVAAGQLAVYQPEAAYIYEHHRMII